MSRQHRDIERLLGQTLPRERMPEGLAAQTMDFIRQARQRQAEEQADEQSAEPSAAADNVIPFERARADRPQTQVTQAQTSQAQAMQVHAGVTRRRRRLPRRRVVQLLAACLVAASLTVGTLAVASETAQVEVGGTSSIELGLNRLGVVVRVDASDPDLDSQAESLGLVGKSCTEALEIISADADLQQTMADEGMLVINVSSSSDSQQQGVLSQCETASESFSCETTCMASRASLHDEAAANGMGAARYSVYLQIAQIDPSVTVEQCQDMSMRQLRDLLAQVQAQANAAGNSENSGTWHPATARTARTRAPPAARPTYRARRTQRTRPPPRPRTRRPSRRRRGPATEWARVWAAAWATAQVVGRATAVAMVEWAWGWGAATAWVTEAAWAWVRRDRARPTVPPGRSATSYDGRQTARAPGPPA